MRARALQLKQAQKGLDAIFVDYLQIMGSRQKYENRTQEVGAYSRGLKALAKELDVPVIALAQLSRRTEQRGSEKEPQLSDLRESGAIEQDADLVIFLSRPEYYDKDTPDKNVCEVIIAKQRNGPDGALLRRVVGRDDPLLRPRPGARRRRDVNGRIAPGIIGRREPLLTRTLPDAPFDRRSDGLP